MEKNKVDSRTEPMSDGLYKVRFGDNTIGEAWFSTRKSLWTTPDGARGVVVKDWSDKLASRPSVPEQGQAVSAEEFIRNHKNIPAGLYGTKRMDLYAFMEEFALAASRHSVHVQNELHKMVCQLFPDTPNTSAEDHLVVLGHELKKLLAASRSEVATAQDVSPHWEGIESQQIEVESLKFQYYVRWDSDSGVWVWWIPAIGKFTQSTAQSPEAMLSLIKNYCELDKHLPSDYSKHFSESDAPAAGSTERWIPVSEKLPEENQEVLIWNGELGVWRYDALTFERAKQAVTHWKSIKPPPRASPD